MENDFICKIKLLVIPCKLNQYRPKFLDGDFLLFYGLILLILKLAVVPFLFYFPKTDFFADITRSGLFELTNSARINLGLSPLRENPLLDTAAYLKAKDMIKNGYFAHSSPSGIAPWYWLEISGYFYKMAGENLAIGFLESEQVHSAWMQSGSHKKNILNQEFQEMGIAVVKDNFQGKETTLVVQFFGTPKTVSPLIPVQQTSPPVPEKVAETETPRQVQSEVTEETEVKKSEEETEAAEEEKTETSTVAEKEPERPVVSEEELKEAFALAVSKGVTGSPVFALFQFMTSDYYHWVQRIIYGSLILIIIILLITVFCDIFIYHKFKIDYRDVVFKAITFSGLWFVLLFLDKTIMTELINPQKFLI